MKFINRNYVYFYLKLVKIKNEIITNKMWIKKLVERL